MTDLAPDPDPGLYLNPWCMSPYPARALARGARRTLTVLRRHFEIRRLNHIAVLPVGWDVDGRHQAC